jgi:hypothetical protein
METIVTFGALGFFGFMCLMSLFRPYWALVLIFSFFGYEQLISSYVSIFAQKSWLMNVITTGFAGVAVASSIAFGRRPFRGAWNATSALVFALYIFAYFGITYSMMPSAGVYFLKSGLPSAVLMLGLLPLLVSGIDQIERMCVPLLVSGCLLITMILISPRTELYGLRLYIDLSYTLGSGELGNVLAIAEIGGLLIIIAVLMEPKTKNPLIGLLRVISILLGLSIAFLVGTRGQLVFSVFIAIIFYPVAHEIKNIKQFFIRAGSIGIFSVILMFVASLVLSSSDAGERFSSEQMSDGIASRMYFINSMLSAYGGRPGSYLQGLGTGSFNAIVNHDGDGYLYPHNLVIEILTHHGLIGFSLMSIIFLLVAKHSMSLLRSALSGGISRSPVAIVLALGAYVTLISLKQGSFLLYPLPFYMFLVISKLYTKSVKDSEEIALSGQYEDYEDWGDDGDWEDYSVAE